MKAENVLQKTCGSLCPSATCSAGPGMHVLNKQRVALHTASSKTPCSTHGCKSQAWGPDRGLSKRAWRRAALPGSRWEAAAPSVRSPRRSARSDRRCSCWRIRLCIAPQRVVFMTHHSSCAAPVHVHICRLNPDGSGAVFRPAQDDVLCTASSTASMCSIKPEACAVAAVAECGRVRWQGDQ